MFFLPHREYVVRFGNDGIRCYDCWDVPMKPHEVDLEEDWQREWRESLRIWLQEQEASGTL